MAQYEVAGTTVQNALALLKEEGLVHGQPGKGVFVTGSTQEAIEPSLYARPAPVGEPYPWVSEAAKRSQQGSITLLDVAVVEPPFEVGRALGLPEGGNAVLRKQVLLLDGEPTEFAMSYYPLNLAEGTAMMARRKIRGGTPALLAELGYPPVNVVDEVSSEIPTEEEVVALQLPKDRPVLVTFRVVYAAGDRPIEASLLTKPAHHYRVRYQFSAE